MKAKDTQIERDITRLVDKDVEIVEEINGLKTKYNQLERDVLTLSNTDKTHTA